MFTGDRAPDSEDDDVTQSTYDPYTPEAGYPEPGQGGAPMPHPVEQERKKLTIGDGLRFGIGFLIAQLLAAIVAVVIFAVLGGGLLAAAVAGMGDAEGGSLFGQEQGQGADAADARERWAQVPADVHVEPSETSEVVGQLVPGQKVAGSQVDNFWFEIDGGVFVDVDALADYEVTPDS